MWISICVAAIECRSGVSRDAFPLRADACQHPAPRRRQAPRLLKRRFSALRSLRDTSMGLRARCGAAGSGVLIALPRSCDAAAIINKTQTKVPNSKTAVGSMCNRCKPNANAPLPATAAVNRLARGPSPLNQRMPGSQRNALGTNSARYTTTRLKMVATTSGSGGGI